MRIHFVKVILIVLLCLYQNALPQITRDTSSSEVYITNNLKFTFKNDSLINNKDGPQNDNEVFVSGSVLGFKDVIGQNFTQHMDYNLEISFDFQASNPTPQGNNIFQYVISNINGTIHFWGTAKDIFNGTTTILNFDYTFNYLGPQSTGGTLLFSNPLNKITSLTYNLPIYPTPDRFRPQKIVFTYPNSIHTDILNFSFWAFDEDYFTTGTAKGLGNIVTLIHGITGSNSSWGNLKTLLEDEGFRVKYFSYPSSNISHWTVPLETLSRRLNDSLATWNNKLQISVLGFDIIGHSMGGLIARYFIAHQNSFSYADNVNKLITLGTPQYGALGGLLGNLIPGSDQGNQMQFGSEFLWDLHQAWIESSIDTDVLSLAGANDNFSDDHDGTVLLPSASLENLGNLIVFIPRSHGETNGLAYITETNHPSYIAIKEFLSGQVPQ